MLKNIPETFSRTAKTPNI